MVQLRAPVGPAKVLDAGLFDRGRFITAVARWVSLGFGVLALALLWDDPLTRRPVAVAVGAGYAAWLLASEAWLRRRPRRTLRLAQDVADAAAVGLAAAAGGGMASPIWLLLYPHVVAVSVRAGLAWALAMGVLDAGIVVALTAASDHHPLGALHALSIVFCGFMGGLTSSHLKAVLAEHEAVRREQADALARLRESELQLAELDRMRREYLRNVSHEFRTPLTVIKGYSEFLVDAPAAASPAVKDVMRVVVDSCDRVIDMVDTLIDVSRIEQENGGRALELATLDLKEVTAAAVESLRPAAERKNVALQLELRGPLRLTGDRGLLQQAVRKLVDNAVKYSAPGGRVVLRGREEGQAVALEVEDSGIGIAAEHVSRIFEKFYMVDGGVSRRAGGTGVGLYLVREIVRLHDGTVEVHSRPGQGTRFSVRLPRASGAAASA